MVTDGADAPDAQSALNSVLIDITELSAKRFGALVGHERGRQEWLNPAWIQVERAGIEPATSGLQSRRSPS